MNSPKYFIFLILLIIVLYIEGCGTQADEDGQAQQKKLSRKIEAVSSQVQVVGVAESSITLKWADKNRDLADYEDIKVTIFHTIDPNLTTLTDFKINGIIAGERSFSHRQVTISGLEENQTYYFLLVCNDAGIELPLNKVGAETGSYDLDIVQPVVNATETGNIRLEVTGNSKRALSYLLSTNAATPNGNSDTWKVIPATGENFSVPTLYSLPSTGRHTLYLWSKWNDHIVREDFESLIYTLAFSPMKSDCSAIPTFWEMNAEKIRSCFLTDSLSDLENQLYRSADNGDWFISKSPGGAEHYTVGGTLELREKDAKTLCDWMPKDPEKTALGVQSLLNFYYRNVGNMYSEFLGPYLAWQHPFTVCSNAVQTFRTMIKMYGINSRVHVFEYASTSTATHTALEIYDEVQNKWIYVDPFNLVMSLTDSMMEIRKDPSLIDNMVTHNDMDMDPDKKAVLQELFTEGLANWWTLNAFTDKCYEYASGM